jgi:hypothetical protein
MGYYKNYNETYDHFVRVQREFANINSMVSEWKDVLKGTKLITTLFNDFYPEEAAEEFGRKLEKLRELRKEADAALTEALEADTACYAEMADDVGIENSSLHAAIQRKCEATTSHEEKKAMLDDIIEELYDIQFGFPARAIMETVRQAHLFHIARIVEVTVTATQVGK